MSHHKFSIWIANSATLVLVVALGLQIAWWIWHVAAPPTNTPIAQNTEINPALARSLFGDAMDATTTPLAGAGGNNIALKGVYAAFGRLLSAAVVNTGGKDQVVLLNQDIQSGVKLLEVNADHIFISRNGARERINLEQHIISGGQSNIAAANAGNFRLNVSSPNAGVYNLSRQELNTVLQDPRQLNYLGRIGPTANGGVRVEDAPTGSLSEKLGLKVGDLLTKVNGQNVNSAGDLARLYSQFGTLNQIRAEIMRGGSPMLLTYTIQN